MLQIITNNWAQIGGILVTALPILDIVVRLTPTKKDDTILGFIEKLLDTYIPNNKTGGGTHD